MSRLSDFAWMAIAGMIMIVGVSAAGAYVQYSRDECRKAGIKASYSPENIKTVCG